ncbi:DNA-dependent protein kinase catalytic subunit isoform X2 [Amia ocellicauda]|uniref:DNA-dependent protein kinase catalytic subunit isoform X2 n=1 Tax=Amia ocellicauda TaxID=2972642 RepID=UPI0034640EA1
MALSGGGTAVTGIQGYLQKLHSLISSTDIKYAALECHNIIGDLGQECMVSKNENELVLQTSLIFSKEDGLLSFLRKSLNYEDFRDVREETLKLVLTFIEKIKYNVKGWEKNYAVDIKDMCLVLYTKDKAAKCRVPALDLLIKLLHISKDCCGAQDLKVGEIFNKFYGELSQKSRIPDTVLGNIYELLGVLGEVQPCDMVNNSEKLYRAYLGELKSQITSTTKEPKLPLVAGCLKGLTALMVNFTKSMEEDPKTSQEIFDYALKSISPQTEFKRYAVLFAGLKLFARHAAQFSSCLMDNYRSVFEVMSKWCGHTNGEIKKTGYFALESFLKQVAILVAENAEVHKSKLKFFMHQFCSIIKTTESTNKELSIAIRGYGLFAAPCKVVCPNDVDFMYTELIQRCKQMYLTETDTEEDNVYQLPSFLDSIASVIFHLDRIPEVYTPVLERLLVVQIDSFPQYSQRMQPACCRSIIKIFVAMAGKGPVLWSFISTVVHQGVIRVCSKPVLLSEEEGVVQGGPNIRGEVQAAEAAQVRTGEWKVPSYRDYLDLFRSLLDCDKLKESGFLDGTFESQRAPLRSLNRLLYDELIKSILKIVEKLDLSVQKQNLDNEQGETDVSSLVLPSSDPTAHLLPNKPKDFTAFVNLVEFCSELLLWKHAEYFEQWVYPLGHELVLQSTRFPLVSGFYKLLSLSMKIAKKIKYFQGVSPKSFKADPQDPEKYACFALFAKFGKEVSVRMKQYKDELLASCLTFVLSLHHDIVALDIKAYIPALQTAFKLGLSHAPLASAALDALEEWSSFIPRSLIQPHYRDVLPYLDGYLKTATSNDEEQNNWEVMCLSSGTEKGYGKVLMRLLKKSKRLSMIEDSPSAIVRRRVVRLLGHLGGQLNRSLVTVPFADLKPVIYLDTFLPRITELALSTSDRQTKVAACELLHSVVVYMLGKGSQIPEGEKSTPPMYRLHKRIFPVLLHLACDVDQVTRQLFEPLVMQLIHWFTNNKKFESQDTVAILEAILDGVVDPVDSTLRDFCGQCIQEFLKWSIKQTTPQQQEKSPANTKSLFKRLYSLALHPNVFKRLGAALAFNSIYKQFREESALIKQFVFEALVIFVESLALAHSDEKSLGTLQQCSDAIDHLKRIIKHKAASLNEKSKRRVPRGFPLDKPVCLSDVVMWLLVQCGRPQTECRHKCMELLYEFVPLLPGKKSPAAWLEDILKKEAVGFLVSRFEGGGRGDEGSAGLLTQTTLKDLQGPFSLRATLQWMDLLLAALDCYNTFIGLHFIKPHQILEPEKESIFLKAIGFFISELSMQDISAAELCSSLGPKGSLFSPREREDYNYNKGTIIVRLLEFVTMVLDNCQQDFWKSLEMEILNVHFFELVATTVCEPSSIGFNMADVEVMTNLPEVCVCILKALVKSPYKDQLEYSIRKRVSYKSVDELCGLDLYNSEARSDHTRLGLVLSACKQLHRAGLLNSTLQSQDSSFGLSLGSKLLSVVYKGIAPGDEKKSLPSMDVGSRKLADGLLQLAFSLGGQSEQVVSLLLNTIMLSVPLSGTSSRNFITFSHGEYFYSLFQQTINTELLKSLDSIVPQLMKAAPENPKMVSTLLNGMLDQSFRERTLRKSQGSRLVERVLHAWSSLHSWWGVPSSSAESKMATLTLLSKVLQIDSSVCFNTNHEAFKEVFVTYNTLITDPTLPLNLKSHALIILPFFTNLPESTLADLQKSLEVLVASHFPMQSDEFHKGSLRYNNYVDSIKKFLDALELSQNPMLLKLMAEILCRDQKHIMEDLFQTCFKRIIRRSDCESQVLLMHTVYQMFQAGALPSNTVCQAVLDRVLLTLVLHCSPDALRNFFVKTVNDIMDTLQTRFTKFNEVTFETQLIKKNGSYKLLDVLYSRMPKEEVYSKESTINQAFRGPCKAEGNELSKTLLKSCFDAFTENMAGETLLLEKRRQYHCAAYNCAIAVISCSFNETKFYQGFLFSEKPEKNQFIFENIIDVQRTYRFPVEIEVPLERKKKYIAIRKEAREAGEGDADEPHYLSSQSYMADSSLSEEMSQFDFSTGVQSFSYGSQDPSSRTTQGRRRERAEAVLPDDVVELEMDELNQHECMASMTALINHMQRNNITPKVDEGTIPTNLPPWMKFLHGKLGNPSTPLNIRLFIAKLIINTEEIFRPYAKLWLGALLQLVVSGNNGGEGIHFMVVEIVATVLSWTSNATPKDNTRDEVLANRLLEFLMKNSFHEKRAVFRHNLEIIKITVECWKDCLVVPYSLIFDRFSGKDPNSKDNSVGIQLLGIVLANNLPPYDPKCEINHDRYFQCLANNISFIRYKEIYAAAAEVIGLVMQYMVEKEKQSSGPIFEFTATHLKKLQQSDKEDKFIICLSKVVKHFPPFMERFANAVFYLLPKMHGVLKTHCLECVLSRAEEIPDIYLQLKSKDFAKVMGHRDEARQRVCLDIVHKIQAKLQPMELQEILGPVTSFTTHPSPVCRERMYDIIMWIHDNYRESDSISVEISNVAKETLLQGLVDENQGLQLYVRNFWSHESRLPKATLDRMLVILQSLYSSKIETRYLSLATNLLLEMTSQSPDYTRAMFEYPLSECTFQDYIIDSNWRHRSTVLTPMFVETQATQSGSRYQSQEGTESAQGTIGGQLRATQATLDFTPTQTPGRRSSYNWLTGNSVDTLADYSLPSSSESLSSSLLVFGKWGEKQVRAARKPVGPDFGKKRLALPGDEVDRKKKAVNDQRADILRLRRRFLKDQEKVSLQFARKGIREQRQQKENVAERKMRQEGQVTLYRSYRQGDLPDIQIQHSSLIAPLQALAQRDPTLAKQLFSSLFSAILVEMETCKSAAEQKKISEELLKNMNSFLSKSTVYFPPFVTCVQDMSYQHRDLLKVDPGGVSSSCLASLQQPMGILLLEESLIRGCVIDEPPTKRARGRCEVPPDTERWIHLAKLYRSLGDYDVLRGIFSGKIGAKSITNRALQAEAKSDYSEAVKLYNEALNTEEWIDGDPTDTEKDFWEIAALESYSHLTEWKSLQYCSTVNIDDGSPADLEKMWSDPFYQEAYLPYMMRSMVKLLQMGELEQSLLTFVDNAMKVEEKKTIIETNHSQELSLLYILQDDYDRAKYYVNNCMQVFMQNYSSIDALLYGSRLTKLQAIQALTEIQDFLSFITKDVSMSSLRNLIRIWMDRYPDAKMDPMNVWDDIITNRCFFLDKIKEKLASSVASESMEVDGDEDMGMKLEDEKPEDLDSMINHCKFSMKLKMADSARKQNNFSVATKLLKELHRESKTRNDWLLRWVHSFSRFSHSRSQSQSGAEQIGTVLKTIPLLEDSKIDYQNTTARIFRDQKTLLGTTYHIMATALSRDISVLEQIGPDKARKLQELSGASSHDLQQVVVGLHRKALELLQSAVKKAEEEVQSRSTDHVDTTGTIEAYMTLANFCDKRLWEEEQSDQASEFSELPTFPGVIVEMMLKALKMNSKEAQLKFPRLLQIIELYPAETLDLMAKEVSSVPCWQLIGWISQMMALLDKKEAVAVQHVIQEIAQSYPQAIVYPFMISSENYEFEDSATGHRNQEFVTRLKSQLDKGGVVKDFIDALQQLSNPDMLFKDCVEDLKNEAEKPRNDKKLKKMYEDMYSMLGILRADGMGPFRKKFVQKFSKEIDKIFGKNGSTMLSKKNDKAYWQSVDQLVSSMREAIKMPGNLKEYSPWMSSFRPETLWNELEIPGQYDGKSKPLPEYHAKITGFDERVKVMTSIRKPKRLIIRGNDEREYPFLVKGGEDLRQDQRIEQLFGVMNIILSHDAACSQRNLALRTYQVIPMTSRIGLIEWMENTCTLKEFLISRVEDKEIQFPSLNAKYNKWLDKMAGKAEGLRRYEEMYKKANRTETLANFKNIEQMVPEDLLRRAFIKMSTTPEAFLSLRSHFTSSHALMCVSQWILGIGDRHLSNFMINMETGGMVGIDFGHAFGSATQFLPVPELMPFRLTRQFLNLMQPMRESGLIYSVMVHSLRAYRTEPDLLLNTMDVFVKEPSLDWKNLEKKQMKKGGTWTQNVNTQEINWYPMQKVSFARRKLEGANPAVITSEELKLGHEKNASFHSMEAVVLGQKEHNVRASTASKDLSVETQVECLIDQATDPNILGRVYEGWEPWI